jgi:hypothetical protein
MSNAVTSVLSSLGLSQSTAGVQSEVDSLLSSLGYETAVCGPVQWGCVVIYACAQEAALLRFDLSPVSELLADRFEHVRDVRVKVV